MTKAKRESLTGRGTAGKTAVIGIRDRATNFRAQVIQQTDAKTLQGFRTPVPRSIPTTPPLPGARS